MAMVEGILENPNSTLKTARAVQLHQQKERVTVYTLGSAYDPPKLFPRCYRAAGEPCTGAVAQDALTVLRLRDGPEDSQEKGVSSGLSSPALQCADPRKLAWH